LVSSKQSTISSDYGIAAKWEVGVNAWWQDDSAASGFTNQHAGNHSLHLVHHFLLPEWFVLTIMMLLLLSATHQAYTHLKTARQWIKAFSCQDLILRQ